MAAQFEVSELALLQDVLFAFQGINGRHVTYSPMADAFVLSTSAGIPRATRDLVGKLVELGWLFVRVRHYVDTCRSDRTFGLAGQAFCAALHHELTEYYRLMAALEGQVGERPTYTHALPRHHCCHCACPVMLSCRAIPSLYWC